MKKDGILTKEDAHITVRRFIMGIIFHESTGEFHLYNEQISYLMKILRNGQLGQLYFGRKIPQKEDYGYLIENRYRPASTYVFDGEYSSVKGVTDVQSLYIKVGDRDNATSTTILHEFGHFLDYCCNFPSEKKEFLAVLEQETPSARAMGMEYGPGDNEEYFAESFLWYLTAPEDMESHIPLTYDFIRRCLTETIYEVHE